MWRAGAGGALIAVGFGCACGSGPSASAIVGGFAPSGGVAPATPSSVFEQIGPVEPLTTAGLQAAIVGQAKTQLPPGASVTATCPSVPATPKTTVHCTVVIDGTAVDWSVYSQDGRVMDIAPAVGVLRLADARAAVAQLFNDYTNATVDCGPGTVAVVKVDDEIQCTISDGTRSHGAHVIVTDDHGHFSVTP